jgi:hypothetical protein
MVLVDKLDSAETRDWYAQQAERGGRRPRDEA